MTPVNQKQTADNSNPYVLALKYLDKTMLPLAGGKGANLGQLLRIDGIGVPPGFCLTTTAYREVLGNNEHLDLLLNELATLQADNREAIAKTSANIRNLIEEIAIPGDIENQVSQHLQQLGEGDAYAVRSSATAEDLPTASFAGQQDTCLNVIGKDAIFKAVSKCWASLFTDRAVIYRLQNGFDHSKVYLSVVIQKMVIPDVAGIMFTADPVTSNRTVISIDASLGLGEALVSGIVNADNYKVSGGMVVDKMISVKKLAVYPLKDGGIREQEIDAGLQNRQALTDEQILRLASIGLKIAAHFGSPQDIEWCLRDNIFYIVQSRPITTLYPVPYAGDNKNHVYVSVGHQQMMTDALRPLGLSMFRLITSRAMFTAGGRLFVDVAQNLASPAGRQMVLDALGKSDPLIKDALTTIIERGDFIPTLPDDTGAKMPPSLLPQAAVENDPAIVAALISSNQQSIAALKQAIKGKEGANLFDFILQDIQQLKKDLFDSKSLAVIVAAMDASAWINEKMGAWLGEKNAADTLSQSVPNNITSQMGLALLDVADVIRPYPGIVHYLQHASNDNFLDGLLAFKGGHQVREAMYAYLDKYGMRCPGEIDITKTRWSEKPAALIPIILNNIKNFGPGASQQKYEHGLQEALQKEKDLLHRVRQLPGGGQKADETAQQISLLRNMIGYREYPKYGLVSRTFVYKQAIMVEARRLAKAGVIDNADDIYYLNFEELHEAVRANKPDKQLISQRKVEHQLNEKLNPPRVITSDGEIIAGKYNRDNLPIGAIVGLPVSSGVIEGRARVILNMENADLEEGDILVTTFTDPSWTPLFVSIKGLVTEVGGLMTHGAVIAREYGLPAVVGVENATRLIKDGQQIRVSGTDGYVEVLL